MSDPKRDAEECFLEYGVRPARIDADRDGNLLIDLGDESLLVRVGRYESDDEAWQAFEKTDKAAALEDRLPVSVEWWTYRDDPEMVAVLPLDVLARLVARAQEP